MSEPPPPTFLSIDDFAARLSVHKNTVKNWMRKGMPHIKVGAVVRIKIADADAWLSPRTPVPQPVNTVSAPATALSSPPPGNGIGHPPARRGTRTRRPV